MPISLVLVNKKSLKIKTYMILIKITVLFFFKITILKGCQKLAEESRGDQEEPKA